MIQDITYDIILDKKKCVKTSYDVRTLQWIIHFILYRKMCIIISIDKRAINETIARLKSQ